MMKKKLTYHGGTSIPDFLIMLPIKEELKQKYGITTVGFAIIVSQLLRRSETINSDEIELTSNFISKWTGNGYKERQINNYLKALREMKFISWVSIKGRPRTITINYDLLNKMSRKYDETIGLVSTEKKEEHPVQPVKAEPVGPVNDNPNHQPDEVDIINRIVSFLVSKGTTMDIDYIDEIRDTICGGDDSLRRRCTKVAKETIIDKKLI